MQVASANLQMTHKIWGSDPWRESGGFQSEIEPYSDANSNYDGHSND